MSDITEDQLFAAYGLAAPPTGRELDAERAGVRPSPLKRPSPPVRANAAVPEPRLRLAVVR